MKIIKCKKIKKTKESEKVFEIIKKLDDEYSKENNFLFGGCLHTHFMIIDRDDNTLLTVTMEGINPSINFSQELEKNGFKFCVETFGCEVWKLK